MAAGHCRIDHHRDHYRTRADGRADCGLRASPFAVGNAVAGGEILARAGENALKRLPGLEVSAGLQISRTVYAGMRNQALGEVLGWYQCLIREAVTAQGGPDLAARLDSIDLTFLELSTQFDMAESASSESSAAFNARLTELSTYQRPADAFVISPATFAQYVAGVNPSATWIRVESIEVWGTASAGAVSVSACGGVVRKAISDGGSALQRGMGSMQAGLVNFLDPQRNPRVGLTALLRPFAANPATIQGIPPTSFRGCAQGLAQQAAVVTPPGKRPVTSPEAGSPPVALPPTPTPTPMPMPTMRQTAQTLSVAPFEPGVGQTGSELVAMVAAEALRP